MRRHSEIARRRSRSCSVSKAGAAALLAASRVVADRFVGVVALVMALVLTLPIPLGNRLPAVAIIIISLGLAERDGVWVGVGTLIAAAGSELSSPSWRRSAWQRKASFFEGARRRLDQEAARYGKAISTMTTAFSPAKARMRVVRLRTAVFPRSIFSPH